MRPISASSIELWETCQRKWVWAYLYNMRDEAGFAAEAGKKTHALLEEAQDKEPALVEPWVTPDFTYDISRMARALWCHNPQDEPIGFEVEFVKTMHGLPFKGFIDWLSSAYILDWKTTGSDLKWAKTPTKLKTDVQRLVYSEAYPEIEGALWVTGTWGAKDPSIAFDTYAAVLKCDRKRDAEKFRLHVLKPAEQIALVPEGADPLSYEMPKDASSNERAYSNVCMKFNQKCQHFDTCHTGKKRLAFTPPAPQVEAKKEEPVSEIPTATSQMPDLWIEWLFVDCLPLVDLEKPLVYAQRLIDAAAAEVCSDVGLKHVLLAEFGKGPHMLAVEVAAQLELAVKETGPVKFMYLSTKTPEGKGALQAMMSKAKYVIQGFF